jgi:hypothetical protein
MGLLRQPNSLPWRYPIKPHRHPIVVPATLHSYLNIAFLLDP